MEDFLAQQSVSYISIVFLSRCASVLKYDMDGTLGKEGDRIRKHRISGIMEAKGTGIISHTVC